MLKNIQKQLQDLYKQKESIESEIKKLEKQIHLQIKSFITLSDAIYINKLYLSSSLINSLKELASFENPQVQILQNLRKPLYNTPRVINTYEDTKEELSLPRGLMRDVITLFKQHNLNTTFIDNRFTKPVTFNSISLQPRDQQLIAIEHILKKDFSIFVAPPGYGKTFIGAKIIEQRGVNTLVIVNKNMLLDQWIDRFVQYFGYTKKEIGFLGKSKNKLNFTLDIATMQSLKNNVDLIKKYSFVIVDECHHIPAITFEKIIKKFSGKYILGLSATPRRKDGLEQLLFHQLGHISYEIKNKKTFTNKLKVIEDDTIGDVDSFADLLNEITINDKRNQLIIDLIKEYKHRKILVLTDRIEHIENLELLFKYENFNYIPIHGALKKDIQEANMKKIETSSLVLATTSFFGEGIDFAHLDTVIFTMPISYYGRLVQYLGRIGRGGDDSLAIDILDIRNRFALSSFKKRKDGYKQLHYTRL